MVPVNLKVRPSVVTQIHQVPVKVKIPAQVPVQVPAQVLVKVPV